MLKARQDSTRGRRHANDNALDVSLSVVKHGKNTVTLKKISAALLVLNMGRKEYKELKQECKYSGTGELQT